MKTCAKLFLAFAMAIGFSNAYSQASGTATASMSVLTAISVTKTQDLVFTSASAGAASETIAVGAGNSAGFDITAEPGTLVNYTVTGLDSANKIGISHNANCTGDPIDPTIDCILISGFVTTNSGSQTTDGITGNATVSVGATREVLNASQVAGAYTGTFDLTVTY